MVQWLTFCTPNEGAQGLIPSQGIQILCAATKIWLCQHSQIEKYIKNEKTLKI